MTRKIDVRYQVFDKTIEKYRTDFSVNNYFSIPAETLLRPWIDILHGRQVTISWKIERIFVFSSMQITCVTWTIVTCKKSIVSILQWFGKKLNSSILYVKHITNLSLKTPLHIVTELLIKRKIWSKIYYNTIEIKCCLHQRLALFNSSWLCCAYLNIHGVWK